MKRLIAFVALGTVAVAANAQYQSQGVRFLSQIALNQFPGSPTIGSALYGYTSPSGREYAIIGVRTGESVVDVTNPSTPVQIGFISGPSSDWHENVTLGNYCYAVTDSGGAVGIRIIDLTNADSGNVSMVATYNGGTANPMSAVHTIQADPTTNRLYANGGNNTGVVILDASNPTNLVRLGRWNTKYVHDCLVKNFTSGPYAGKQIIYAFCGTQGLYILDATNPAAITVLGSTPIYGSGSTYCHSGSLTPDAKYMLVNDEFDENTGNTQSCTTIVVDVQDLAAPARVGQFKSGVSTIDHNSHLRDGHLFLSAYEGGLRIYNAANPLGLFETGYFDTYPSGTSTANYNGNWGVYAYFASGNIILSDRQRGLFVLDPTEAIGLGAPIVSFNSAGIVSGGIAEARKSDDTYLVLGPVARTVGTGSFFFQTTFSPVVTLDVTLEARGNGTGRAYLKNLSTGNWDLVVAGILNGTDRTLTVTGVNPTNYVNASGQIEGRVDVVAPSSGSRPQMAIDMFQVKINRS
ncbi:MAG: choice-of-anchor B family protein [Fimbriimonadaceae bacterium]